MSSAQWSTDLKEESALKLLVSPATDISDYRAQVSLLFGSFGG